MRFMFAAAALAILAWLTARPGAVRPAAGRAEQIAERGRTAVKKGADLVGLCAYLAVMNRGLPDKDAIVGAYRATNAGMPVVPYWGEEMWRPEETKEPVAVGAH